jgi:KaiC/GvpD/RAD55 family RecA-like ATPase
MLDELTRSQSKLDEFTESIPTPWLDESLRSEMKDAVVFKLLTAADLDALPPHQWLIRGVLPREGLAAIYGPPGSGKSFLALDLLANVAAGRDWFNSTIKSTAPIVYVALEGEVGVARRVRAWAIKNGTMPERFRVVIQPVDIRRPLSRNALIEAIQAERMGGGVLCLDTLSRAAPGIDENSSAEMGEIISAAKALQAGLGGLVVLVHHSGKDATKGLRGHSSLLAALDAVIEVSRDGDRREWRLAKAKDGEDGAAHAFKLAVVELGEDSDGEPITSCVCRPDETAAPAVRRAAPPGGGNMRLAYDAICAALKASRTFGMASAPPGRPCIELATVVDAVANALPCEPKRKRERAQQAITALVARKNFHHGEGWLWLP